MSMKEYEVAVIELLPWSPSRLRDEPITPGVLVPPKQIETVSTRQVFTGSKEECLDKIFEIFLERKDDPAYFFKKFETLVGEHAMFSCKDENNHTFTYLALPVEG